jgi:hypothetical protein
MIITGISNRPHLIHERSDLPSSELVLLAHYGLKEYQATHLVTTLSPGWEQALAKAARELDIPYTVAIPYPGRDQAWKGESRIRYYELMARASEVYQVSDVESETASLDCHIWMADRSDHILALWNYEFFGDIFQLIDYGIKKGIKVTNLWQDWESLYTLKRMSRVKSRPATRSGAQVYETKISQRIRGRETLSF